MDVGNSLFILIHLNFLSLPMNSKDLLKASLIIGIRMFALLSLETLLLLPECLQVSSSVLKGS